jgi:4-hydroxybenzoate polyprenyltransferase
MGPSYWVGVVLIAGVLIYEHAIVTPTDLSRINKAFFDLNGYISLVFLAAVALSGFTLS